MIKLMLQWLREYKHPYYTITYRGEDAQRHIKTDKGKQRRTNAPVTPNDS